VHRQPLDGRTDVFNFGATLYWTLTGRAIPTALRTEEVKMKHEHMLQPLAEVNTNVPPSLAKLVEDCIEPIPARRPGSMKEVASRLGLVTMTMQRKQQEAQSSNGVQ